MKPEPSISITAQKVKLYKRAIQIIKARFGIVSNNPELIFNPEFFEATDVLQSLLTNEYQIRDVAFEQNLDAYIYMCDLLSIPPSVAVTDKEMWVAGNLGELDAKMVDRRYGLFGNMGLFFKYALTTLERYHDVFGFHASAMYIPWQNELILILGGPGAGKTVLLLEGLRRGYQIFATEMTHFQFGPEGCVFFKGSLLDNVRIGNLVYDFPEATQRLKLELPRVEDVWGTKVVADLHSVTTEEDIIVNPRVTLLFPRIEAGRDTAIIEDITDERKLIMMLFGNATEKIAGTVLLYGSIPIGSLDTPHLMRKRLKAVERFAAGDDFEIKRVKTILAGTRNCMEGI